MSALQLATELPPNVVKSLTLAAMIEKANAGELSPDSVEQAMEFARLCASALVHLSHYTLQLTQAVKEDAEEAEHEARCSEERAGL